MILSMYFFIVLIPIVTSYQDDQSLIKARYLKSDITSGTFPSMDFCTEYCLNQCKLIPLFGSRTPEFQIRYFCNNIKETRESHKTKYLTLSMLTLSVIITITIIFVMCCYCSRPPRARRVNVRSDSHVIELREF
uniref:Uncharacterized protein n=1 Tax=Meloidogyne enterolobii TaxID=390850 RepID=A0A6V7X1T2_MELEN|nr:unnamed protein product [Meloidogyne enterolobii]